MIHLKKPRPWVFRPTLQRILFTLLLFIISSFYHGQSSLLTCPHEFYGLPGEVYYQTCTGSWQIGFLAIVINLALWYIVACLIRFYYEKMKFGV